MASDTNRTRATEDSVVSIVRSYGVPGCEGDGFRVLPVREPPRVKDQGCEGPFPETTFPYVAGWAGEDGAKAVAATQVRVATAARRIIDASPAPHLGGGRPPGVEGAVAAAEARREGLGARLGASTDDSVACEPAAEAVGL